MEYENCFNPQTRDYLENYNYLKNKSIYKPNNRQKKNVFDKISSYEYSNEKSHFDHPIYSKNAQEKEKNQERKKLLTPSHREACEDETQFYKNNYKDSNSESLGEPNDSRNYPEYANEFDKEETFKVYSNNYSQYPNSEERWHANSQYPKKSSNLSSLGVSAKDDGYSKLKLKDLKYFLEKLFSFEKINYEDLEILTRLQRQLLSEMIHKNNYMKKEKINEIILKGKFNVNMLNDLSKDRIKEANLKYGFRIISKYLFYDFEKVILPELKHKYPHFDNGLLIFFLYYFGEIEYGMPLNELMHKVPRTKADEPQIWNKLKEYFLPGMGMHWGHSKSKRIGKEFLVRISQSKSFAKQLKAKFMDVILYLGYFRNEADRRNQNIKMPHCKFGKVVLKELSDINLNEINKMFHKFDTKIRRNQDFRPGVEQSENTINVLKKVIKKHKFKLLWTFKEIQGVFVDCFLTLNEFIYLELNEPINKRNTL